MINKIIHVTSYFLVQFVNKYLQAYQLELAPQKVDISEDIE